MTDPEARLAAALHDALHAAVIAYGYPCEHVGAEGEWPCRDFAARLRPPLSEWLRDFAKDNGAAAYREGVEDTKMEHAADLALAAAVLRLEQQPQEYTIEAGPQWYAVQIGVQPKVRRDSLLDAITAALEDKP